MALANSINWEIRSTATAGNVNGGGFVTGASGVDYSQQDAAQYALTGVTSAGAGNTVLTASAAADMVGNIIRVVSGTNFTASWFEITSVVAGVSITCSTNNAGTAISTGVGSNGVMNVGGALSLGATDDNVFENGTPGSIFWVKNGSYTTNGTISTSAAGTAALPIKVVGYNATRGDGPQSTSRPTIDLGATRWSLGVAWWLSNLILTSSITSQTVLGTAASRALFCKIIGTSTTSTSACTSGMGLLFGCELVNPMGIGCTSSGNPYIIASYIHDCDIGVTNTTANNHLNVINTIIANCVTAAIRPAAISTAGHSTILGCTLYGSEAKQGIGIDIPTGGSTFDIVQNNIVGFVTGINHADAGQTASFDSTNNFYNNTTDVTNYTKASTASAINPSFVNVTQTTGTTAITSGGTLVDTGKDFVAEGIVANQDYLYVISGTGVTVGKYLITGVATTVLTTSPALTNNGTTDKVYNVAKGHNFSVGVAMISSGNTFPGGLTTGYRDRGAVQRREDYPAAANVLSSAASYGNSAYTGTYVVASAANVKTGTAFGAASAETGTYDGSDRWTDPGEANVRSGTAYKANNTSNNKTGTCSVPTAANVRSGTAVDATTGTCAVPIAANVRSGTSVDATTGTCAVPTASQVLSGVSVDATTGNVVLPPVAAVLNGFPFGPSSGSTGVLSTAPPPFVISI